ncbi:unnamed protein product [Toxocara canis]|uniref:BTB domain-containing protein n=1 Tax=Toxocara canis TaxID=6265 RepID=A0A183UNA5_TOXCA|nr:unnamed protein product [Toxocara canis]
MIRCFSSDIRAHFAKVGEYMRDCRVRRDQRLVDIRVQCHNFNDFMHSSVGAAHSQLIREIIDSRRPPYDVNMMGFAPQAVVKVIDWMYYGEIEVVVHEIGEYLAVTGAMGIEQLHKQLEVRLQQCAIRADLRIAAINIATEPRYKVSAITQSRLVALIASETDALTQSDLKQLTPKSVIALVSDAEVPFVPKVNLLNDAVQWLKLPSHAQYMDLILSSVRIPYLNTTELYSVITEIRNRLMSPDPRSRETVYVYTPDGKRIVVGCGPEKYSKSAGVVVPHPAPSTDIGEEVMETTTRQQTSTTTETKQTVRSPIPLQQMGKKGRWGLPHENIYRPNQKGSQELINARAFTSDERAENDALPDLIGHGHKKYPRSKYQHWLAATAVDTIWECNDYLATSNLSLIVAQFFLDALIGPFRAEPIHMQPNQMPGGFNRGHEPMPHPQMANQLGSAPGPTQGFGGPMNGREPLPNPQMMNQLGNVPGFTAGFGPGGGFGPMQRPQTPELRNLPRDTRGFGPPGGRFGSAQRPRTPDELRSVPGDTKGFGPPGRSFGPMQRPQTPEELRHLPGDSRGFGPPGRSFGPMQRPQTPGKLRNFPGDVPPGAGSGSMPRPQTQDQLGAVPHETKGFGGNDPGGSRPLQNQIPGPYGDNRGFGEVRHPYRSPSQQRYSEMPHAMPYQMGPQMAHQMPPHMQSPVPPNMQQQQMIPRMYPREQPGQIPADEHRQPQAQSHMMPQAQQHMPYHLPSTHPSQIPPGAMMPPTRLQNQMYPQPQFTQHPSQPQTNDRGMPPQTGPHVPFAQSMPIPRDAQMRPQMPPMQADHNAARAPHPIQPAQYPQMPMTQPGQYAAQAQHPLQPAQYPQMPPMQPGQHPTQAPHPMQSAQYSQMPMMQPPYTKGGPAGPYQQMRYPYMGDSHGDAKMGMPSYRSDVPVDQRARRMSSIIDIRILPERVIDSAGSHSQYTFALPGMDTFRQIDSLPNISYRSGSHSSHESSSAAARSESTMGGRMYGAQSTAEMRNLPNHFSHSGLSRGRSDPTINRRAFGEQSIADINALPDYFGPRVVNRDRSDVTLNRRAFGEQSIADINTLPNYFTERAPHRIRSDETINRRAFGEESIADINELPNFFDKDDPRVEMPSETDLTLEQKRLRYTPSEIMEVNAHPDFVPPDYVIGKKHLTREELEELREIPSITGTNSKLPIINRYEFTPEEIEDIKNLPNITNSQFTIGRRLRSEEELRDLAQLPNLEDKTPRVTPASYEYACIIKFHIKKDHFSTYGGNAANSGPTMKLSYEYPYGKSEQKQKTTGTKEPFAFPVAFPVFALDSRHFCSSNMRSAVAAACSDALRLWVGGFQLTLRGCRHRDLLLLLFPPLMLSLPLPLLLPLPLPQPLLLMLLRVARLANFGQLPRALRNTRLYESLSFVRTGKRSAGVATGREVYASRASGSGRSNQAGQASRGHQGDDYASDPQGPTWLKRDGEPPRLLGHEG